MTPIKFAQEELTSIKTLQDNFKNILIKFGELGIERIMLENQIKELTTIENTLKNEYLNLQTSEESLLDSFTKKYGEGSLNMKDGTFTPSQK